ncbi:uncharacterized protein CC84DRAFT_1211889 [Paraphaeosphaeria sporulosa]|uniref:Mid2 domain-containing protein n=1 Tax=Paraphaeosphaeria sporulosa TaxID=1460663 RepID=A0A177CYI4_9PLEO|nr:uncharacterized protein CC84DRAFT_1211889 [Paraphaeosphaeria sporulosa]OAG12316.1 hypothetical protein CC84DRAFT_1211889 [Paraphaeosphaeria sporulosa]
MLLHALLLSALAALVSADCYSHDRIKAQDSKYYIGPELVSCGNGTDNCCLAEQKCGSNLLCVDGSGGVSRQYCDNAAWIGCSDMCAGNDAAGVSIHDCGDNIYCCGVNTEDACCTDERAFYVDPDDGGVTQTTVAAKTKAPRWFTVDSSSLLASMSSASSSLASSTPSSTPASTSAPAATTASSASSATPTPTETAKGSSGISGGAGAGIGIGAAAGIALVAALMWFLLRKKKQNASRGAVSGTTDYPIGKSGPQPEYYAHNVELDNGNLVSQELDGGNSRHELATHAPKTYPGL